MEHPWKSASYQAYLRRRAALSTTPGGVTFSQSDFGPWGVTKSLSFDSQARGALARVGARRGPGAYLARPRPALPYPPYTSVTTPAS